jgi:YesN/AraC family two-component response regulator
MKTVMAMRIVSIAILAMGATGPGVARADIYRCVLPSGETEYQAKPCSEGTLAKILDDRDTRKARADAEQRAKQSQIANEEIRLNEEERITRWTGELASRDLQVRDEQIEQSALLRKDHASCDLSWARSVRAYALHLARIEEVKGQTVCSFRAQSWSTTRPQLPQLVRAATNADSCLSGRSQRIDFYAPDGKPVGFSDPKHGTNLVN